jgi:hypothetical protein
LFAAKEDSFPDFQSYLSMVKAQAIHDHKTICFKHNIKATSKEELCWVGDRDCFPQLTAVDQKEGGEREKSVKNTDCVLL